ncbi:hypothetical protein VTO42DRAFT_1569 [Malbranchea cinnamomea]
MPPRLIPRSVCRKCMLQSRRFSSSLRLNQQQPTLPLSPPSTGYARLTSRALISLAGRDATTFLQGLITQNIVVPSGQSSPNAAYYAAFLNPQGRVLHDVFIYPSPETGDSDPAYLVEVDKAEVEKLLKHLKKYKLRAKLTMRPLDEGERSVWASWDEKNESIWTTNDTEKELPLSCEDKRAPRLGYRIVADPEFADRERYLPGAEVPVSTYNLRRMLHGVPEGQTEIISGSALPMESNMDIMGGIDFHKGCYVGQELTIRTHHRGVIRKRILPVQFYEFDSPPPESDAPVYLENTELPLPPAGASITRVSGGKSPSPGKFLSGIGNVGLALCRLETVTDIAFTGEATRYNPDEEFAISWDAESEGTSSTKRVKVKAFIPPWTRGYILRGGARHRTPVGEAQRAKEIVEELEGEISRYEEPQR